MKKIKLTKGKVALVDDKDFNYLNQFKWYAHFDGWNWYTRRNGRSLSGKRTSVKMHREIMDAGNLEVDHIDHNGLNNQRSNLRLASRSQNMMNRSLQSNNKSGFKGVSIHKKSGKWVARAKVEGKQHHLGLFDNPLLASKAYEKFVKIKFGKFNLKGRNY